MALKAVNLYQYLRVFGYGFYYSCLRFCNFYFRSALRRQKKRSSENENAFSCVGLVYWSLEHQLHRVLRALLHDFLQCVYHFVILHFLIE